MPYLFLRTAQDNTAEFVQIVKSSFKVVSAYILKIDVNAFRTVSFQLAAEIFHQAVESGLDKLVAEVLTVQKNAQRVFARLGFQEEAVLKDHGVDADGNKHDLIIMSNIVSTLWENWTRLTESVSGTRNGGD